jgi:hypothetical protein
MNITENDAVEWLEQFKRASESRDADAMVTLFAKDIRYRDNAFGDYKNGRERLRQFWQEHVFRNQRDVCCDYRLWGVRGSEFMTRMFISYVWLPINSAMRLDGVCHVTLGARENERLVSTAYDKWFDQAEVT